MKRTDYITVNSYAYLGSCINSKNEKAAKVISKCLAVEKHIQ